MSEIPQLSLNFVTKHPREAARILEQLAVEDTAAFLERIPPELGSRLLNMMAPQYTGQCFLNLNPELSATLMGGMKSTSTLSMLRNIPTVTFDSFMKLLSEDKKTLLKKRLTFPTNTIGAWMDSDSPAVPETSLVGDIRRSFRSSKNFPEYGPCVVKADGTIAGLLTLASLAAAKDGGKVSKIMTMDFKSILDRDSLQSAASLTDWNRFDALPVTSRSGKFVGMLTHKNLHNGLSFSTGEDSSKAADSVLEDCVTAYTSTLSWLVQTALSSPSDPITNKRVADDR